METTDTRIEAMGLPGHRYPLIVRAHRSARFVAPRFLIPDALEQGMMDAWVPPESEVLLNVESGTWSVLVDGERLAEFASHVVTRKLVGDLLADRLAARSGSTGGAK